MSDRITLPGLTGTTSRIGFGTGGLLRIGSARERQRTLAAALASGITHFDTAPMYGLGESERALGRFLGAQRHNVTLTTKFGLRPSALASRLAVFQRVGRRALKAFPALRRTAVRHSGALYAAPCFASRAVLASLESSLRALRTDYVDFYLAHQATPAAMPADELIEELERLQSAGKIRGYGIATDFDQIAVVLERCPRLSRIVQYDREPTDERTRVLAGSAGQLVITYGALGRSLALCRAGIGTGESLGGALDGTDPDALGGLLLRAAVLANPRGIVLMQSRSPARIARNVRAATSSAADEEVNRLLAHFRAHRDRTGPGDAIAAGRRAARAAETP